MSYVNSGYDQYFDKSIIGTSTQISNIDADILLSEIDASSLTSSGSIKSNNNRLTLDLSDETFAVNDGTIERIRIGAFEDGEYGMRIVDKSGNILFNITGTTNLVQSPDQKMQLDLTGKQLRVYDDKNLRVLLGEL